ncbi:MAG: acyltransferase [Mycobacterium sp.]|uniref:acyltransferase family protein n=1 Tax=Mycobacterium sp. TaxID=1785 RepID=UPI0026150F51|nr:acyltransferase [Mycobacterium sp.]MDI3315831.1 acyltransferase [Mycobacterium sp.]
MDHPDSELPVRDLAVDCYRVSGVVLIVLGHWLDACVTYHDGHFGRQNPLVDLPWTQWLTWVFQAVPVFFLVAGYAGAVSWTHRRDVAGMSRQAWLQHRLARVLGPTTVYVAVVSVVVVALGIADVAGSALEYGGWAVAMHLWFLAVYLLVVSLTPLAMAAQRRWGLWTLAVLAAGLAALDAASLGGHLRYLGQLKYLLCWGTLYQLGIAWHAGLFAGRRAVALAAGTAAVLGLLVGLGPYPVSMIGVPGQPVQNSDPPSLAMLAYAGTQAGVVMALAPALNRALRSPAVHRAVSVANSTVMGLYLWHMVPVVIVAIAGYPAGLLPQPPEGTASWWLARLVWVVILGLVTTVEMTLLWWWRRFFAAPLPLLGTALPGRRAEPMMLVGAAMAVYGLWVFAADGFAPGGRFAWLTALVFAVGVFVVALRPAAQASRRPLGSRSDEHDD